MCPAALFASKVAEESEAGRKGAKRSEKARVPEEGGLTRNSKAKNL